MLIRESFTSSKRQAGSSSTGCNWCLCEENLIETEANGSLRSQNNNYFLVFVSHIGRRDVSNCATHACLLNKRKTNRQQIDSHRRLKVLIYFLLVMYSRQLSGQFSNFFEVMFGGREVENQLKK